MVCEKNIFHLFRFTQPVENLTYGFKITISGNSMQNREYYFVLLLMSLTYEITQASDSFYIFR